MVYPNGRTIDYNYSGTNLNSALDYAIGRLDSISDGANSGDPGQVLEQYSYLGLSTIVARNHPQTGINLTLVGSSGSIGSGGDQYVGLDQFGRIVDQNWVNTSTGQSVDNFTYSYDANSNVTAENNLLDAAYSQTFTYDPLNRLGSSTLGGAAYQSWTLDSQGNWNSHTIYGNTQTQTANAQNQITSISGTSATPTYDASGNTVSMGLTTQPAGSVATLVYDAWNRLVAVKNSSGQIIAQYSYNAMGYRITESYPLGGPGIAAGTTNYIYYDSNWQAIETRTNGTANNNVTSQMVWSAAYINAAILQDPWGGGNIALQGQTYFLQDANWNTVAVTMPNLGPGPAWFVGQRYVYSPYGNATILNADWSSPPSGETPAVDNLYQGMTLDPMTGLYYARNRNYSPSLGRWINQDPAGYINGANTYQFVESNPAGNVDPWGLDVEEEIGDDGVDMAAGGGTESPAVANTMAEIAAQDSANNAVAAAEEAIAHAADNGVPPQDLAQADGDLGWAQKGQNLANDPNAPLFDKEIGDDTSQYFSKKAEQALKEPKPETKGPTRPPCPEELQKLRNDFNKNVKPNYWRGEAAKNPGGYSPEDLARMREGNAPIGPDGYPMELHHRVPLSMGGTNDINNLQAMTRTAHRLGNNFGVNHPSQ